MGLKYCMKEEFQTEFSNVSDSFLRTCPRVNQPMWHGTKWKLKEFPTSPCACALKRIMALQNGKEMYGGTRFEDLAKSAPQKALMKNRKGEFVEKEFEGCHFYIIDEKADFCYWKFIANPINHRVYTLESISLYLGTTCINVWLTKNMAVEKTAIKLLLMGLDDLDDVSIDFSRAQ